LARMAGSSSTIAMRRGMRLNIPEGALSFFLHFSSPVCHRAGPAPPRLTLLMQADNKEGKTGMPKSRVIAVELAAQAVLALAVGTFVSVVLAGAVLLLAA